MSLKPSHELSPTGFCPNGAGSSGRHQSLPGALIVGSIPGRPTHLVPTKIPPQDRGIGLVQFKFCPNANPFPTLDATTAQHVSTKIRLKTCSSRNPNRNNKVTLHTISINVAGTTYNYYTIKPLINL
eukprot:998469-Pelagomonas_calceolata.AAC.1